MTFKYDACGNTIWSKTFNHADDFAHDIKVDTWGNVLVTGGLLNNSVFSYGTLKYNNSGVFQWSTFSTGPEPDGSSTALKICIDANGNSYVTGVTSQLNASAVYDIMTIKYNSSGVYQWQMIYNFADGDDIPEDITKDSQGNIYIVGGSAVMAYEIPQDESSGQNTFTTIKYNSNFEQQWVKKYFGTGATKNARGKNLKILNSNEIYVSGYAKEYGRDNDFVTIKYNSSGSVLWTSKYNRIGSYQDIQTSLSIDSYGNVYVTGYTYGTTYFQD